MLFKAAGVLRAVIRLFPSRKMLLKLAVFGGVGAVLRGYAALDWWLVFLVLFVAYLVTGGWRFAEVVIVTLPRDLRALTYLIRLKYLLWKWKNSLLEDIFRETMKRHPNKVAFVMDEQQMTFRDVEEYSNAVANIFMAKGYRRGDTVAVVMDNRPEYAALWLGLSKAGIVGALINYNLRKDGLAHCINVARSRGVIFATELSDAVRDIIPTIKNVDLFSTGPVTRDPGFGFSNLDEIIKTTSSLPPRPVAGRNGNDCAFYVYTSGTTGLPKAAVISHIRFLFMAKSIGLFFNITKADTNYSAMPLYHSAAGILGVGQVFINGTTMALRKKFSASNFWHDCIKYNATIFQYIGEINRYLFAQPYRPEERQHKIRLAFGNGCRAEIWKEFVERFNVKSMGEFYGATEGNGNVANMEGKVGAVGFTSVSVPWAYPVFLIKIDPNTGEIVRDSNGLCIRAEPGEEGHMVGKIKKGDPTRDFHGYADQQANNKKVIYDVLSKGDSAFLSGDVMMMDKYGYFYFRDRSGDTFRWKGENVSTSEVESTVSKVLNHLDAVVYGVEVPGSEGRAGMVAIVDPTNNLNIPELYQRFKPHLPSYAVPIFIRMMSKVDTTGTFKLKKVQIRKEGFDANQLKDRLFYLNYKAGRYEDLTPSVYQDILSGKIRL